MDERQGVINPEVHRAHKSAVFTAIIESLIEIKVERLGLLRGDWVAGGGMPTRRRR